MTTLGPGTRLGKYRLETAIGSGGMGHVWAARNEATGAEVAIKVLLGGHDDESSQRFRQEARIGALLMHRNVVRVFDLVEDPSGALVLVMERLRGQTLDHVLTAQGRLSTRATVAVVQGVLDGLTHAHEKGFVHRDVKPSNILLAVESDGLLIPKVLDFGIAKAANRSSPITREGILVGTPEYMSPEQISGKPVDERSDVFACGVMVYESLTGRAPFAADSINGTLVAILQRRLKRPPEIDPHFWPVLESALCKRPVDRFPSARAFSLALQEAAAASPEELASSLRRIPVKVPSLPPPPAAQPDAPSTPPASVDGMAVARERGPSLADAGHTPLPGTVPVPVPRRRGTMGATAAAFVLLVLALVVGMLALRSGSPASSVRPLPIAAAAHEGRRMAQARPSPPLATASAPLPSITSLVRSTPPSRSTGARPPPHGDVATNPGF
ncbi:MAG: serine/threonine protein kinase [Polyangiaceae bacterium]|nr:serine/threonine protein kinase [Polyangiaceae bacterium]